MAEKEKDEHATQEEGKKKSSNMLLIIIIAVLVLILVIGGVVAALMMGNNDAATSSAHGTKTQAAPESYGGKEHSNEPPRPIGREVSTEVGLMFPLDTFTVNLLSESGRRYLKVEMNLEIEGKELSPELDTKKPVFRDIIIRILSSKSLEEISTIKGKEKLKEELVNELNMRLKDGKVKNIYFTDFVVQ
jgi:flagellar protein FliL